MGRLLKVVSLLAAVLAGSAAHGQYVRWDQIATTTAGQGQSVPLLAIPGAAVTFYSYPGMTLATTYNASTSPAACPTSAQVVPQGTASCVATADVQGNFGAFFTAGQYAYTLKVGAQTFGPYQFTVGGGDGGTTYITQGTGISVTGAGTAGNPYVISVVTPLTINSFTGCGASLEIGATVTNPTCAATYSATPASASITNTDSVDSPLTLSTPFTSGTIVGSFHHAATATTTVTLTAVGSSTQTATQTYTWNPRIFGGVGASGATAIVTASGTTAVLSTSDALPSVQLGAETVGQVIGTYSPSGQVVYLLLTGGSHTFTDAETGFPFAFNSPLTVTFVNVNGVSITMYLYASTNPLTGTFQPKVAS